jgi:streptogramin lyase
VDPAHGEVRDPIQVGVGNSQTVRTAFDAVWVLIDRTLYRINPATDEPTPFVILPLRTGITTFSVAFADAIWLGASDGALVRIDPRTEARTQVDTGLSIDRLAATTDDIWAVDLVAGTIVPFDRESLKPDGEPIEVGGGIDQITGRGNALWILDRHLGTLTRIDVTSGNRDTARVGDEPTDITVGLGAIWVGDRDGSLYRVDPVTLEATAIPIGADVAGVAVDEASDSLWVYVGKATEPASP